MDPTDTNDIAGSASLACLACRKQKRRCDKKIPACGLCVRIGRPCDYSEEARIQPDFTGELVSLKEEIADLKRMLSTSSTPARSIGSFGPSFERSQDVAADHQLSSLEYSSSENTAASSSGVVTSAPSPATSIAPLTLATLFFLDSSAYAMGKFHFQTPYVQVPPGPLAALGGSSGLRHMIEDYFQHFQPHFPMISRIRLFQHLSNPRHEPGADMALLFLAMKLSMSQPAEIESITTPLYQEVKGLIQFVETRSVYSIHTIQALILVALYELGQGIYPAVYMSTGHAARAGYAMGIHDPDSPQMISRCTTWTEQEERRRVWWAITILDSYVNNSHRNKPFATHEISLDAHLPIDDTAWDQGKMLVAASLALCASRTVDVAPFARTCQAAHFMGKIGRHINDKNLPIDFRFDEALQLDRTGKSLLDAIPVPSPIMVDDHRDTLSVDTRFLPFACARALCYSALLGFYDAYSCTAVRFENPPETQLQMQKLAIEGLSKLTGTVLRFVREMRAYIDVHGTRSISPLTLDCLYQAAANFAWYLQESSDRECEVHLTEVKDLLRALEQRWRVAGDYLRILDASESVYANLGFNQI